MSPAFRAARDASCVLAAGTLASFCAGLGWPAIIQLGGHGASWWRIAVAEAEGRGLLRWESARKLWFLTELGRRQTRGIS
jgi:hypothetical protein